MLGTFTISRPRTVAEALQQVNEDSVAYWGGTELFLAMQMQLLVPQNLVDLKGVPELRGIRREDDRLVIGAGTTHAEVAGSELVRSLAPVLAAAERGVGNARVRAQGTVGGNLCFAEPRSDLATVLLALDGSVRLAGSQGRRELTVADFVLGPYWTAREPDELLVDVVVPLPAPDGLYRKLAFTERPTIAVAAVGGAGVGCRLAIGAVADVPVRHDFDDWSQVHPEELAEQLEPTPDLAGSVTYKRHATAVLVRRTVAALQAGRTEA